MDFNIPIIGAEFLNLDDEKAHNLMIDYEAWVDKAFAEREINQEEAWDCYFGLLHECDIRGFDEDRKRIVSKIDITRYNPFLSKNPGVVFLTRLRAVHFGLVQSS